MKGWPMYKLTCGHQATGGRRGCRTKCKSEVLYLTLDPPFHTPHTHAHTHKHTHTHTHTHKHTHTHTHTHTHKHHS